MKIGAFFLVVCLLISFSSGCVSYSLSPGGQFENELNNFKYSLYKDLQDIDYYTLSKLLQKGFADNTISQKSADFYDSHRDDIAGYQRMLLQRYTKTELNLSDLKEPEQIKDVLKNGPVSDLNFFLKTKEPSSYGEKLKNISAFFKLTYVNPVGRAFALIIDVISWVTTSQYIAVFNIKSIIARPLIKTTEKKTDFWEIIIDEYDWVFYFDFDGRKDTLYLKAVYRRL